MCIRTISYRFIKITSIYPICFCYQNNLDAIFDEVRIYQNVRLSENTLMSHMSSQAHKIHTTKLKHSCIYYRSCFRRFPFHQLFAITPREIPVAHSICRIDNPSIFFRCLSITSRSDFGHLVISCGSCPSIERIILR